MMTPGRLRRPAHDSRRFWLRVRIRGLERDIADLSRSNGNDVTRQACAVLIEALAAARAELIVLELETLS